MKRLLCFAVVLATYAVPMWPAEKKQPWEWTLDERLAERFDPRTIRERDAAYVALHPRLQGVRPQPLSMNEVRYRIDGRRNPELFLPHELFDRVLDGFDRDPVRQSKSRAAFAPLLKRAGFDPDQFWSKLESASSMYLTVRGLNIYSLAEAADRCHARYAALNAAREAFGSEQFDRVLYTVVAPTAQFSVGTTARDPVKPRRSEAGGCDGMRDSRS